MLRIWVPVLVVTMLFGGVGTDDAASVGDVCGLGDIYGALSPDQSGLSYSLEIISSEKNVDLRATQWNDTDETVSYAYFRSDGYLDFVIADPNSCDVIWKEDGWVRDYAGWDSRVLRPGEFTQWYREWDRDANQGGFGKAPPGTYQVYVVHRSQQGHFIPLQAPVEVKAVRRSDPPATAQKAEPALRTIDLGRFDPIAGHGDTLILSRNEFRDGYSVEVFYEFDKSTGQKTEIPEPENVGPRGPQRSCEPSPGLKAVELDLSYVEHAKEAEYGIAVFDVEGILEVNLKGQWARALVFVGPDGDRYVNGVFDLRNLVWSDDCRYAAWSISDSCDLPPHSGPIGVYLYDSETDSVRILDVRPGEVAVRVGILGDLLVVVGYCFRILGTTVVFLE